MELHLRVIAWFLLCCCSSLVVSGSSESNSETRNSIPIPSPVEHLEGLVSYFKAAQDRNREQEKVITELKQQIKSVEEKHTQELKRLSDKFEQLENKISTDDGLWLLTPPLRGPPGKSGDSGVKGERELPAQKGDSGKEDKAEEKGNSEPPGPKGNQALIVPGSIKNCRDAMKLLPSPRSTKQWIYPHGNTTKVEVLCDFAVDGDGWTVIQKRSSGPRDEFDRNWSNYTDGFGSVDGNFWLGLANIRALTKNGDQELRIELEDFEAEKKYAKYSRFSIADASDFYRLTISGFSGTATDSMTSSNYPNNGMKFTTKDKDNDEYADNCAAWSHGGGWWYPAHCSYSILNGLYREKGETFPHWQGILWYFWKQGKSLAKTEMKIRTRI